MPPVSSSSKATPVPLAGEPLAVAGDARLGGGDRLAAADQAVDQGALADVWKADDGDRWQGRSRAGPVWRASSTTLLAIDLLGEAETGGVELDRVAGGAQGAVLAGRRRGGRARAGRRAPPRGPRRSAPRGAGLAPRSEAVRKTFSGASGLTTVPMSRPSAT